MSGSTSAIDELEQLVEDPEKAVTRVHACLQLLKTEIQNRISSIEHERHLHSQGRTALSGLKSIRDKIQQLHTDIITYSNIIQLRPIDVTELKIQNESLLSKLQTQEEKHKDTCVRMQSEFNDTLSKVKQSIHDLKNEMFQELELEANRKCEAVRNEYKHKEQELQQKLSNAELLLEEEGTKSEVLQRENEKLQEELRRHILEVRDEATAEKDVTASRCRQLEQYLDEAKQHRAALQRHNESISLKLETATQKETEVKDLHMQLQKEKERKETLGLKVYMLQDELESIKQQQEKDIELIKIQLQKEKESNNILHSELRTLQDEKALSSTATTTHDLELQLQQEKESKETLNLELHELHNELEIIKHETQQEKESKEILCSQLRALQDTLKENNQSLDSVEELKEQLQMEKERNETMSVELQTIQDRLKEDYNAVKMQLQQETESSESLRSELRALQDQVSNNDQLDEHSNKLQLLTTQYEQSQQLVTQLELVNQELVKLRSDDATDLSNFKDQLREAEEKQLQFMESQKSKDEDKESLQEELHRTISKFEEERTCYEDIAQSKSLLEIKIKSMEEQLMQQKQLLQEKHEKQLMTVTQDMEDDLKSSRHKVKQLQKINSQLQDSIEKEYETNKHHLESFNQHKMTVIKLDEELRKVHQELKEEKTQMKKIKTDNGRFKALIKQLNGRLKDVKSVVDINNEKAFREASEKDSEVNLLKKQLDKQIAIAEASSSTLASLSLTVCIKNTLNLLSAGCAVMKPVHGHRAVFFPIIHSSPEVFTTEQLHYSVNLLYTLAFNIHYRDSNVLETESHKKMYLLLSKPSTDKSSMVYYWYARLFLCVYVLSVEPLLQCLAAQFQHLQPSDQDYLLMELERFLHIMKQPYVDVEHVLYMTESKEANTSSGTIALTSTPLIVFLSKISESLRGTEFKHDLQPKPSVNQVIARTQGNSNWFCQSVCTASKLLLKNGKNTATTYPNLHAALTDTLLHTNEVELETVKKQTQEMLNSLQAAAATGNQAMWNETSANLSVLCNNKDVSFIDVQQLMTIIQTAKRNGQLKLQSVSLILTKLQK